MFETVISQMVKVELTNEPVKTEWFNGCLFVSPITSEQASQVARMLRNRSELNCSLGHVEVTPIGDTGEYAFDFVEAPEEIYSPYLGAV
jgi:hypothetical protein